MSSPYKAIPSKVLVGHCLNANFFKHKSVQALLFWRKGRWAHFDGDSFVYISHWDLPPPAEAVSCSTGDSSRGGSDAFPGNKDQRERCCLRNSRKKHSKWKRLKAAGTFVYTIILKIRVPLNMYYVTCLNCRKCRWFSDLLWML